MDRRFLKEVIGLVNEKIKHLDIYIVVFSKQKHETMVENLTKDCFDYTTVLYEPGILLFDLNTGELLSYLMFDIKKTSSDKKFLAIELGCTSIPKRRRRLSTYLRMVLFYYSIMGDISYVASNTNSQSLSLLRRYGFEGEVDNYLELFSYEYTTYVSTKNKNFREKVEEFLS